VLLSEKERLYIEQGAPRSKATLGFDYTHSPGKRPEDHPLRPQTLGTYSGTAGGVRTSTTSQDLG
jgi:iron complex outermembrane receptor protein